METPPQHVTVDSRGRVSLGKLAKHTRYLAREETDGTLILEPAVVLTAFEARALSTPGLLDALRRAQQQPRGRPWQRHPRPHPTTP